MLVDIPVEIGQLMLVDIPVEIGQLIFSIKKPGAENNWQYSVLKSNVKEINRKVDRTSFSIRWRFITYEGTSFAFDNLNKTWFLDEHKAIEKVEKLNSKKNN